MLKYPVKARAMGAMKRFSKQVRELSQSNPSSNPEQSLGRLDDIVRSYFADKLNLVRHAHTFEELENVVDGRADIEPMRGIYDSCAHHIYSEKKSEPDIGLLMKRAQECIETINKTQEV